jgi:diguanylate cyclase (GGDEF)-like protein
MSRKSFTDAYEQDPDALIRVVRWVAVALAVLLFTQAAPPLGPSAQRWGLVLAGGFVLVNVASIATRGAPLRARRRAGWRRLAADTALALAAVWILRDAPAMPASALLVLPLVEGAIRGHLRGALVTYAITAAAFVGLQLPHTAPRVLLLAVHTGMLAMVALACGLLAEDLGRQMEAQREARLVAGRRAQLLATVAAAARDISSLDATTVLAGIVDSAIEVGFDCAEMCVLTADGRHWESVHPRGLPRQYRAGLQPLGAGVAGLVYSSRAPVELASYSDWAHALPTLRTRGLQAVFAAPVWSGEDLAAVLTAATYRKDPLTASEREAVELLAAQASRALENAHRYAERERLQDQLTHQAFHDALTGLPNRALLRDRLTHTLGRARRDGTHVALVFCDLDGFKLINDHAGHLAGDEVLVSVAARLQLCVRPGDTVARFGGDEFTVLLEHVDSLEEVRRVASRVLAALEDPIELAEGRQVTVSTSIGIAWTGEEAEPEPDRLLQRADRAMYFAKAKGKGTIEEYDPDVDRVHREAMTLEADLRRSVQAGELDLHYQPIVRSTDGRIAAVEALARWHHPARGEVPPLEFIPLAERSGTIVPLGRWVLERACRQFSADALASVRINVNVSVRQLEHSAFLDDLAQVLTETGIDPSRLTLELTEQAVIDDDNAQFRRTLEALGSTPVQLAVDDFGRGFSSLRYLRELPVDEVKLDRSLVVGTLQTSQDRAIVRWTIALAHELGMRVTAEGVETMEQLRCLRDLGCDTLQGFLFEPALPFPEAAEAVRRGVWPSSAVLAGERASGVEPAE